MKKLTLILLFIACSCIGTFAADQTQATVVKADTAKTATTAANAAPGTSGTAAAGQQTATVNATKTTDCVLVEKGSKRQIVGWALIIVIVVVFLAVAIKSDILRDSIANPAGFVQAANATPQYANEGDINKIKKPFSLSKSQLGAWTVVISCTYVYLELCKYSSTSDISVTDTTVLALLGISAATATASSVINNSSGQQGVQIPSEGFFKDIMSDQNGINIHRFQNVVWTIIALILYLGKVPHVSCGELPTLDPSLIALTGISSATYLGLKINENNTPPLTPPASVVVPPVVPPPVAPVAPPPQMAG